MRGEIKIILSGSGGGKSTILKLILGLRKPDEGQVFIDGEDITNYDESQLKPARDKIGMVFRMVVSSIRCRSMVILKFISGTEIDSGHTTPSN